jgi:hypothetical protein
LLGSDEAAVVHGTVIDIDGGRIGGTSWRPGRSGRKKVGGLRTIVLDQPFSNS